MAETTTEEPGETAEAGNDAHPAAIALVLIVMAALFLGALYLIIFRGAIRWVADGTHDVFSDLGRTGVGPKPDAGWLDRLFAADMFVGFFRVVLAGIGIWILASATRHILKRNWIASFSPTGITTVNQDSLREAEQARKRLSEATKEIDQLTADNKELEDRVADANAQTVWFATWNGTLIEALDENGIAIPEAPHTGV